MGKKIGRVIFHITELFQKRWKKYGFFDFSPLLSSRAKSDIFFQSRAKIYYGITLPTKIDHFGFLQTSKILKNAWEIAFWSFLIFLKLALIFDFSQFQGICTRFKLLWNWIFFILSYFQEWCDTNFFTLIVENNLFHYQHCLFSLSSVPTRIGKTHKSDKKQKCEKYEIHTHFKSYYIHTWLLLHISID